MAAKKIKRRRQKKISPLQRIEKLAHRAIDVYESGLRGDVTIASQRIATDILNRLRIERPMLDSDAAQTQIVVDLGSPDTPLDSNS